MKRRAAHLAPSESSQLSAPGQARLASRISVSYMIGGESANDVVAAWESLAARATEPNPFCHPAFVLAWLKDLSEARNGYVLFAWRQNAGETLQLVGVLPVICEPIRFGLLRIAKQPEIFGAWTPPLLDADRPAETLQALLNALAERGTSALLLSHVGVKGPVRDAIDRLHCSGGHAVKMLRSHDRAILVTNAPEPVGKDAKRVTRYARQRRRLEEKGALHFAIADNENMPRFLEQFAELEVASWKGDRGTAFASLSGGQLFLGEVFKHAKTTNLLGGASLVFEGRPIASALFLKSQNSAYYFKVAYDHEYAKYSPGVLLTVHLTEAWRHSPDIVRVDSLATSDNSLINRFWKDRLYVGALLIATQRAGPLSFILACWFERLREYVRLATKNFRPNLFRLRSRRKADRSKPQADNTNQRKGEK